jgi:transposase-like protein
MSMLREGPTPIPGYGTHPVAFNRTEIVALVREVLGDVEVIRVARTYGIQCYRGVRALRVEFTLDTETLGSYLVPLPEKIAALVDDEMRNPYNSLRCTVSPASDQRSEMLPEVVTSPTPSEPEGA